MSRTVRQKIIKAFWYLKHTAGCLENPLYFNGLLASKTLCLPHFLGIGAQKAGTTWLHENLQCHPEIFLPEPKELHHFDWNYHIGVSTDVKWDEFPIGKIFNKGQSIEIPNHCRKVLEDMYHEEIEALYDRFGDPVAGWRCLRG